MTSVSATTTSPNCTFDVETAQRYTDEYHCKLTMMPSKNLVRTPYSPEVCDSDFVRAHIARTGSCPFTRQALTVDQLIPAADARIGMVRNARDYMNKIKDKPGVDGVIISKSIERHNEIINARLKNDINIINEQAQRGAITAIEATRRIELLNTAATKKTEFESEPEILPCFISARAQRTEITERKIEEGIEPEEAVRYNGVSLQTISKPARVGYFILGVATASMPGIGSECLFRAIGGMKLIPFPFEES